MNVVNLEQPRGVIVQFGGQTAINLTKELVKRGLKFWAPHSRGLNRPRTATSLRNYSRTLESPNQRGPRRSI